MTTEDQPALFDVDTPPVRAPKRKPVGSGRPRWSKYVTKSPVRCDDCLQVLLEAKGDGPASRSARWRRVQGKDDLLLCYGHAEPRRAADGLDSGE